MAHVDPTRLSLRSEDMPIGDGFSVAFALIGGQLTVEWKPDLPTGRPHLAPAYRLARAEFMRRVAKRIGRSVMVAEL